MRRGVWGVMVLLALFMGGCSRELYSQFCGDSEQRIGCLKPADEASSLLLERHLGRYASEMCAYEIRFSHYEVQSCSNPSAKAMGSDSDGYARAVVFHEGSCYYRVQANTKGGEWEALVPDLAERLEKELMRL